MLRLRLEVHQDPAREHGVRRGMDVFRKDGITSLEQRPGLRRKDKGLPGTGTGPPSYPFFYIRSRCGIGPRRPDNGRDITDHVFADAHFSYQALQLPDLCAAYDG